MKIGDKFIIADDKLSNLTWNFIPYLLQGKVFKIINVDEDNINKGYVRFIGETGSNSSLLIKWNRIRDHVITKYDD